MASRNAGIGYLKLIAPESVSLADAAHSALSNFSESIRQMYLFQKGQLSLPAHIRRVASAYRPYSFVLGRAADLELSIVEEIFELSRHGHLDVLFRLDRRQPILENLLSTVPDRLVVTDFETLGIRAGPISELTSLIEDLENDEILLATGRDDSFVFVFGPLELLRELQAGTLQSSGDVSDVCESAIARLHEFFEQWFRGDIGDNSQAFERFAACLAPGFELIDPSGQRHERRQLLAEIRNANGERRDDARFQVWIENVAVRALIGDFFIVVYEEWQHRDRVSRGRVSSAVLEVGVNEAPHGVAWHAVHETWL